MPLDTSLSNVFLENLGTPFTSLLTSNVTLNYTNFNFSFDQIIFLLNVLNLWPTTSQFNTGITQVYFAVTTGDSYLHTLNILGKLSPYLYSLDFLHYYYLKEYLYKITILTVLESNLAVIKPLTLNLNLDIIFSSFFNKWG